MTCHQFVEHLADFLSGELRESLRQQAEAHLLECPDCRRYQLSYEITVRLTRMAYGDEPSGLAGAIPPSTDADLPPSDPPAAPSV